MTDATSLPPQADLDRRRTEAEVILAELQVEEKKRELSRGRGLLGRLNISVPMATLIVGLMGFFGSAVGVYLQQGSQLEIKQREIESQLVLSALKDGDSRTSLERLRFLIDSGYLPDPSGRISKLILSGKYEDALTLPSPPNVLQVLGSGNTQGVVKEIIKIAGPAVASFPIVVEERERFSPIAAVTRTADKFTLLYDKAAVENLNRNRTNNWRVAFVLGHEIGHIALGHLTGKAPLCMKPPDDEPGPVTLCKSILTRELEADRFGGCVLRLLGSTLNDAERTFDFLGDDESESETHPPKRKRIEAVVTGWKSASGQTCA